MYIEPNTNIRVLKDVPLDKTFDHTIYFESASAQASYFMGLQKYNLNNYTYQRVKRGYARVGIKADNLYDCNYMMFQNTSYGNKWFYAFITSVEYLNNECSQIEFEIDVMQTWFFDYSLDQCFVEREHTVTDNIGIHIEPENVNLGEYVFNDYKDLSVALNKLAVFADDEKAQQDTIRGLQSAEGYIRRELARTINMRNTPEIRFIVDQSIEYGVNISKKIDEVTRDLKDGADEQDV